MRNRIARPTVDRKSIAFTLIELLVVVAIIAVLVAILLPALSAAREQTRRMVCLSNERQLYIAEMSYAGSYADSFPAFAVFGTNTRIYRSWVGSKRIGRGSNAVDLGTALISPGYATAHTFYCPSREKHPEPLAPYYWSFDPDHYGNAPVWGLNIGSSFILRAYRFGVAGDYFQPAETGVFKTGDIEPGMALIADTFFGPHVNASGRLSMSLIFGDGHGEHSVVPFWEELGHNTPFYNWCYKWYWYQALDRPAASYW